MCVYIYIWFSKCARQYIHCARPRARPPICLAQQMLAQNVDGLDVRAGLPKAKSVAVHGSYTSAQCVECRAVMSIERFVEELVGKMATPPLCAKAKCRGFVKPSIVMYGCALLQCVLSLVTPCNMYGEPLPKQYFELSAQDMHQADCLIILGTSLAVKPFSELLFGVELNLHAHDKLWQASCRREWGSLFRGC